MDKLKPDATGIYVAAHQAPAAIEEAIEAEVGLPSIIRPWSMLIFYTQVPLVVAVAEQSVLLVSFIPFFDHLPLVMRLEEHACTSVVTLRSFEGF